MANAPSKKKEPISASSFESTSTVQIVSGKELKTNLNFDMNTRSPSRHSKAYISMRETLKSAPEMFINLNAGITVSGNHILDGGHTYLAIRDAIQAGEVDPTRVHVRIIDMGELTKDQMADRVREEWGRPLIATSGARCYKRTQALRDAGYAASLNSAHNFGLAIDLTPQAPADIEAFQEFCKARLEIWDCYMEHTDWTQSWVHLSLRPTKNRMFIP